MDNPRIFGNRGYVTKGDVNEAIGDALQRIKFEDRLTWDDVGVVLGKGEDMAALYGAGEAEMGVFAYQRARAHWGARFTSRVEALFDPAKAEPEQ